MDLENGINFSNLIVKEEKINFKHLLEFIKIFKYKYDNEKKALPFHINLIDELHADENAHSRIFAKILRYSEQGKYIFLEKFLNDVCKFAVTIEKPQVRKVDSCGRIDIPIFDNKYVIIIENKVTDKAPDQNKSEGGQLARYIENINKNYNRSLEEIFVVYTPKYTREPSEDCWKKKDNSSYKTDFKDRFCSLSYRDKIYPWLKNDILPSIKEKDVFLRSAIEQYIDYLEGLFSIRKTNKKLNMELQKFIKQELGINDDNPQEAIDILSDKEKELNNAINQIQHLKDKYNKDIIINNFEKWKKQLKEDFPNFQIEGDIFNRNSHIINVGVKLCIENKDFFALIECNDCNKPNIYYGIGRHFVSESKHNTPECLQKVFYDNKLASPDDNWWYGWNYSVLEEAYNKLKIIIEEINLNKRTNR